MLIPILFLALGLFALGAGVWLCRKNAKVKRWPVAVGRILEKRVGPTAQAAAVGPAARFEVFVKYSYSAGGCSYVGDKIFPTHHLMMRKDAERFSAGLPEEVTVYYNPAKPEEATLFSEAIWVPLVAIVFGIGCIIGSLAALAKIL